ncbi:hypothetical protein JSE7799_00271 [Jannaschia seosinensis]|uniref:Uncharacterized protein n=1 Tax=Jannaschia seosinensis TaxID=313367 RepID=A0A0M7B460_9RHOB|nr:hypothetical protein [Jannaschia seosinensis]CUH14256.1 hypothetical protein JSE7799_00271 [Jannaschia seosinensis]
MEYDAEFDDVFERTLEEPPRNEAELRSVEQISRERLRILNGNDPQALLPILLKFRGVVPDLDKLENIVDLGLSEARAGCGICENVETLNGFLPQVEHAAKEAVERGTMKRKSANQRAKRIRHFITVMGDLELREITPKHAFEYAEETSDALWQAV